MKEVFQSNALTIRRGIAFYTNKSEASFAYDPYERLEWVERNVYNSYVENLYGTFFLDDFKSISNRLNPLSTILELGCSSGAELRKMHSSFKGGQFYGLDFSYQLLQVAKRLNIDGLDYDLNMENRGLGAYRIAAKREANMDFILGDACNLPFRDSSMDYVSSHFLLDRVKSVDAFISELGRVLKRGGRTLISSPMNFQKKVHWEHYAKIECILNCFEQEKLFLRHPIKEVVFKEKLDVHGNSVHWNTKLFYLEKRGAESRLI